jgi:hypothetical protein
MSFKLTSGTDQFDCDLAGVASQGGAKVGSWTVGADNKIALTKDAGGVTTIDVTWQVNAQNQLELLQSGKSVFNFHSDPTVRPMLSVDKGVFVVKPDRNKTFSVRLHGDWTFTNDFLLQLKIGTATSTFDGFLNDSNHSAFVYHFNNKAKVTQGFDLLFTGQWVQDAGSDDVKFIYDKEPDAAGVKTGVFDLPHGLKLEPSVNQFFYQYSKGGQTHSIQLSGRLVIGQDFRITYVLDNQVSAGVRTTTLQLNTQFAGKDTDGNLQLELVKSGGTTSITVGGSYTHVFGATALQIGFSYSQLRNGAQVSSVIGFSGRLQATNGDKSVQWTIQKNGTAFSVDVTAHFTLGKVSANALVNIQSDSAAGGLVGVTAMFGFHF